MCNIVASPRSGGRADRAAGQPVCLSPTGPSSATGRHQAGRGVIWSTRSVHFAFHLSIDACGDRPQPVLSLVSIITQTQNANARASTQAIRKTQENYASQKNKLETKASSRAGQCIPAGCRFTLRRRVLITNSNFASDCLRFAKFRPQFCESCGAAYGWICELFRALQSASGPLTHGENSVHIDA